MQARNSLDMFSLGGRPPTAPGIVTRAACALQTLVQVLNSKWFTWLIETAGRAGEPLASRLCGSEPRTQRSVRHLRAGT